MAQENVDNVEIPEYGSDKVDSTDIATQAASLGWKPLEDFEGDPEKWTDSETFLELHSRNNGALRAANKKQAAEFAELKREMATQAAMTKSIFDQQIKKQKEEFDNQVAFLKAQKRNALRDGDHGTAADLDEQIDELKERGPDIPEVKPQQTQTQKEWTEIPELVEFNERNPWMQTDEDMSVFAVAKAQALRTKHPNMPLKELLIETETATRKVFPQKFGSQRQSPVEAGDRGSNNAPAGAKTYQSMPKEARDACDDFVADKYGKREDYVKMYFEYDNARRRA